MKTIDDVLARLQAEFTEMPGLRLTPEQIQRLCGIERVVCQAVLASLVGTNFLRVRSDGTYARVAGTETSHARVLKANLTPAQRMLKAS